jgi:hypothetical protein
VHYRVSAGYVFVARLPAIFGSFAAGLLFALLGIALRGQWATEQVRR